MSATVLARASRAEWSRIWSVRSSWAFAGLIGLAVVGLGVIAGIDVANSPGAGEGGESAWDVAGFTAMFALFGTVAWAVVTGTADHGTGAIVPTLQWTPRRGILLAARTGVIALTMTVIGLALVVAASIAVRVLAPDFGLPLDEGLRRVGDLTVVIGCGALLGIGLGLATRSTAAALVLAIALLLVLPLHHRQPAVRVGGDGLVAAAGVWRAVPHLRRGATRTHLADPGATDARRVGGGGGVGRRVAAPAQRRGSLKGH